MYQPLKLENLDATFAFAEGVHEPHSPHILKTLEQLHEVWSGAFDTQDTITVLRHEARRLDLLAHAIETNANTNHKPKPQTCPRCNDRLKRFACPNCNWRKNDGRNG